MEISALPSYDVDETVHRKCVRLSGISDPLLSHPPFVETGNTYQVIDSLGQIFKVFHLCLFLHKPSTNWSFISTQVLICICKFSEMRGEKLSLS